MHRCTLSYTKRNHDITFGIIKKIPKTAKFVSYSPTAPFRNNNANFAKTNNHETSISIYDFSL